MIYLVTGSNGASKTLNSIKWVCEDSRFKDRPVYYFNIHGLTLDWTELDEEGVKNWKELPPDSVIFIDEVYKVFPARSNSKPVPKYVEDLAEHRSMGLDFIIICQKPTGQFDYFIQGLIEEHTHYERKFGMTNATRLVWQDFQRDVKDYHVRKQADKKIVRFDKKYYRVYQSAEVHTVKSRPPWFKIGLIACLPLLIVFLGYSAFQNITRERSPQSEQASGPSLPQLPSFGNRNSQLTVSDYLDDRDPRIRDLAFTAPVYDHLQRPLSSPKPTCQYGTIDGVFFCRCWSQQATRMNIPEELCVSISKNGMFDPTIPDPEPWYDPFLFPDFGNNSRGSSGRESEG